MSEEIKKGDYVKKAFSNVKFYVIKVKKEPGFKDKAKMVIDGNDVFKDLYCKSENGEYGNLSSDEVEKVKK